jgi:hypothetical protein
MGAGGAAQAVAQNGSGCLTFAPRCCTAVRGTDKKCDSAPRHDDATLPVLIEPL